MRRDLNRIREILLKAEADDACQFMLPVWGSDPFDRYQIELMGEAGLIEMDVYNFPMQSGSPEFNETVLFPAGNSFADRGFRITWQGHEYLDAVRDAGVWAKTKKAVKDTGGSATLEIAKALATGFLKKKISQHTGIEL